MSSVLYKPSVIKSTRRHTIIRPVPSLARSVCEFRNLHRHLQDPMRAEGSCESASIAFQMFLLHHRVITKQQIGRGEVGLEMWTYKDKDYDSAHVWYRYRTIIFDWTYRQVDSNCSFPFICHVSAYPYYPLRDPECVEREARWKNSLIRSLH